MGTPNKRWGAAAAVSIIVAAAVLSGCGTAELAGNDVSEPSRLATIKGDAKVSAFGNAVTIGNAVVHLLAVDGRRLGSTQSKAVVAPGTHTITARCSVPARHALSVDKLTFDASPGETYKLRLRLLQQAPGCATEVVRGNSDDVVARPQPLH